MKIAFYTLGCKVNQYESQIMAQSFTARGHIVVPYDEEADVYVVNSCTVTATGDQKTRQILRRFKTRHPNAKVALTGCFPQAFPEAAEKIPEADIIAGSRERGALISMAEECVAYDRRIVRVTPHEQGEAFEEMCSLDAGGRTRAFVKIEDGCERYCAYCIIPTARGSVRSKSPEALMEELVHLAQLGYRETVLVGINLSCYGSDIGLRLVDAIETACSVNGIERVRLGSLEPELLSDEDISRMSAQKKLCPQFHMSLQSGCEQTLRRMNRHYTPTEYMDIAKRLRKSFNNCAITTDIMVGFPGETEEEFLQSVEFVKEMNFAKAHVFSYSPRPGTGAAQMPDQVSTAEKERRSVIMSKTSDISRLAFLNSQIADDAMVMFENTIHESDVGPPVYEGYTENYTPVRVQSESNLRRTLHNVHILSEDNGYCIGKLCE